MKTRLVDNWRGPSGGYCPSCLKEVVAMATRHEAGWELAEKCSCGHIKNLFRWPFEGGDFSDDDLVELGFEICVDQELEWAYEEEFADYMHEVGHGWEESWY